MVMNVLVDQMSIERIVLAENSQQAQQFLHSQNFRASKIFDASGVEYRKKGDRELVDSSALNKRPRLGVNVEEERMYLQAIASSSLFRYYQEMIKEKDAIAKDLLLKKDQVHQKYRELESVLARENVCLHWHSD